MSVFNAVLTEKKDESFDSREILRGTDQMKEAQFHSKKALMPRQIMEGARMWSVALEKTMFTYFEIDPDICFDLHSHENEQITMVLEGELYFKQKNKIICVKKGEVIAIPANTPHEAFTKNNSAVAVDAWSPVMEKYRGDSKVHYALENESYLSFCIGMKP